MQLRSLLFCSIAAMTALAAGCTTENTAVNPPSETAAKPAAAEPAADVTLVVVDKAGYEAALKKHAGDVVLVDVWATWCAPCKKGFPHTVELYKKCKSQGLAVISLCLDGEDEAPAALAFLQEQGATFTNLRSQFGAEQEAIEAFDIDNGAVPHFKLYDRAGALSRKFVSDETAGAPDHAQIEKAVEELLKMK